jgi:O-antigen/teichoic acid export membrane protein
VLPFKLANPIISSMSGLIMPAVARTVASDGMKAGTRTALKYIALGAILLLPYFAAMVAFPRLLLIIFCKRDSPYIGYTLELRMFVANYSIVFVATMVGAWLAALGRARFNFYAQAINVVGTLAVGLPLTAKFGVRGLIVGGMISTSICLLVSLHLLHKVRRAALATA